PGWGGPAHTTPPFGAASPAPPRARAARAAHHGVSPEMVLPTAGAAEAFTLIARAIPGTSLVIHPQFTEPEAALLAAGRAPGRHILAPPFTLDPAVVPPAELIVVGNPTNPTAVLHPTAALLQLPARTLVVDEAFLDAIPGEPETLIAPDMPGRLVLRSLTKTWALAGIRAGYVVGDPTLIAALERQQPPWSVSTPAVAATLACLRSRAQEEAVALAEGAARNRADLAQRLRALGLTPVPGAAPFVLVDTLSNESPRQALSELGFAVRRGETFPGLGPAWLRLAVRTPDVHEKLTGALRQLGVGR
ncbi:MAG: aminotransferase class I/II-fold pyridoxal phosphate-dependent enzyme, partial [Propionibacteriaceae bacterium]|nr:aminotransferase class I/II-fold pyridoxal phosphate-dependent enzyme [Propionibacteriaceae bacterium]